MEEGTSKSPTDLAGTEDAPAGTEDALGQCGDPGERGEPDGCGDPDQCTDEVCEWDARQWDTREDCEVRQILDRIAGKWSLLVIALLDRRSLRFTELRREVDGISQRMLTVTLRQLERDGLVRRTVHPVVPPRVDYALTPLGATLHATIQSLVTWTERHQAEIASARADYDVRAAAEQAVAAHGR
ncbi:helix-turn-helix domain-containing protein [Streptomyces sp. NPDC050610]|uniref:winged helix-turn-helix transcriptional regulator n=1 Tax=Streptomyces sp. NPDC050610 TaxID=3157097 RepID=UPI00341FCBA6